MDENLPQITYEDKSGNTSKTSNWDKWVYTIIMCYTQLAFGITCTSVGVCLVDFKNIFKHKDMKYVFYYNSVNSVGYVCGSLCGFLYKSLNRQLCIICLITTLGISIILIPHTSLTFLYFCGFVIGIGGGSWDSALNVWTIEMWSQRSGPVLQLLQFAFGIGSIVGPLIDKPFITGEVDLNLSDVNSAINDENVNRRSLLSTPFAINGSIQLFGALMLLIMFCINKYEKPIENIANNSKNVKSDRCIRLSPESGSPIKSIVFLGALSLGSFTAIENCQFQFSPTFNQYIPLKLCASNTALILSLMATCFTLGRGVSIFIAIRVKPQIMLSYHYFIIIFAIIILLFAQNSILFIFMGNILIGIGLSAMWPAMFAYIGKYLVVTDKIGTTFVFATGIMSASSPLIIGPYIQSQPMILIYFNSVCITISIITFILMFYLINSSLVIVKNIEISKNLNNNNESVEKTFNIYVD